MEAVAKQYGVNVIYTSSELRNVATEGVKGKLTAHQAVEKLLEGTPLTIKVDPSGAMMISARAPLSSLEKTSWTGNDKSLSLAESGSGSTNDSAKNQEFTQLEEIVVTAQKREERLLDVPMAITAVTGADLERRGVSSLSELQYSVPGLSLVAYGRARSFRPARRNPLLPDAPATIDVIEGMLAFPKTPREPVPTHVGCRSRVHLPALDTTFPGT